MKAMYKYYIYRDFWLARSKDDTSNLSSKEFYIGGEWKYDARLNLGLNDAIMDYGDASVFDYDEISEEEALAIIEKQHGHGRLRNKPDKKELLPTKNDRKECLENYQPDKIYCIQNEQGVVETYKNGKKIGEIVAMGDLIGEMENRRRKEQFMLRAIELAKECATFDEVPVGAVVVKDGKIIAESGNRKERDNSAISHAEILALKKASEVVGNWWLEDCDVYVTLEPCAMCATAMIHSRIRNLYFGAYDEKTGAAGSKVNMFEKGLFNHDIEVVGGIMKEECGALLTAFFKNKRLQNKEKNK